ncbi:MAG: signal peptidase I [Oscillospiraceae bacterium]|nr:signal peptidase I [Oscillospiraceae bacterium]
MRILKKQRPSINEIEGELERLKERRTRNRGVGVVIAASVLAAAMIIILTNLWFPVLRVVGSSMQPLLRNEDVIVCFSKNDKIERRDIIAFYHNDKVLLKRVVGLPGDVIEIDKDGILYINGEEQHETYVASISLEPCDIEFPVEVPEDSYFVLGDQRMTSMDSRSESVGMVTTDRVVGKALFRVWPLDGVRGF